MANPSAFPLVTQEVAARCMVQGQPWRVRVEMVDYRANTDKFWECFGTHQSDVTLHFGRNGTAGQYKTVTWAYYREKIQEKFGKGYRYARNTSNVLSSVVTPPPPVPAGPPPLEGPFALIRKVRPVRKGVGGVIDGWEALDATGRLLLTLTPEGAKHLLTTYPKQVSVG